jgi:hypothetical protein
MLSSELLDRIDALSDRPRHPETPGFVAIFQPALRDYALDRRHTPSLPMVDAAPRRPVPLDRPR